MSIPHCGSNSVHRFLELVKITKPNTKKELYFVYETIYEHEKNLEKENIDPNNITFYISGNGINKCSALNNAYKLIANLAKELFLKNASAF